MKVFVGKFIVWLMSLTTFIRYLVIAILFHVLILFIMGSIKIVAEMPKIIAAFDSAALPPPVKDIDTDPFAALRDFDYSGPTLGGGNLKTAAGKTPNEYKANITAADKSAADTEVADVIGVVSESANAVARLQSGFSGLAAPTTGFGDNKIGTASINAPGGGGFSQRIGPMRTQKIKAGGGSGETEKAVLAALRWLKEHQNKDGSWGGAEAISALGLLSFLGHGETPDSEEFGATVTKAITYAVSTVGSDGYIKSHNMYCQGAVTLALSEAYGMTQSPVVKEPLERLINGILEAQKVKKTNPNDQGGWRYTPQDLSADTSVTGWLVMGLKSARIAGLQVPDEAYQKASKYLWNMYDPAGGFGYSTPGRTANMTAVGVLCQVFLGHGDNPKIKKSLDFIKQQKVDWGKDSGFGLYGWYYMTQAMFQGGGAYWEYWNKQIRDTLVKAQATDGHWDAPGGGKSRENTFGPVYSTTLCCLSLEVYYRYLPIYQDMEHKSGSSASAK